MACLVLGLTAGADIKADGSTKDTVNKWKADGSTKDTVTACMSQPAKSPDSRCYQAQPQITRKGSYDKGWTWKGIMSSRVATPAMAAGYVSCEPTMTSTQITSSGPAQMNMKYGPASSKRLTSLLTRLTTCAHALGHHCKDLVCVEQTLTGLCMYGDHGSQQAIQDFSQKGCE